MADNGKEGVDVKFKVDVLMHEYDTLRQEVISKTNNRFAISGLLMAAVALIGSLSGRGTPLPGIVILLVLLVIIVFWYVLSRLMFQIGDHLVEIETRVNSLLGDELLTWEQRGAERAIPVFVYRRKARSQRRGQVATEAQPVPEERDHA